jgi:uncharacterized protein (DUF4415 family)
MRRQVKDENMSKTDIRFTVDLDNPAPWTEKQREELERLRTMKNEEIDFSDSPELDEKFWANAKQPNLFRPLKTSTTVRIDGDVIAWLKSYGKGYQTRINAILRSAMLDDKRNK